MCTIEDYSCKLLNYFGEVVYVDENPFVIKSEYLYKENNKLKRKFEEKIINLEELTVNKKTTDLISPECYDYGLLQKIRKADKIEFYFKPKNLFQYFFKSKKPLFDYLNSINKEEFYLLTTPILAKKIKSKVNLEIKEVECFDEFINDVLDNQIIIFKKSAKVYLMNKIKECEDCDRLLNVYCGLELEDFIVINLI